ncbi:MAG TPA: hypothetical protein VFV19_02730 [Candidatus Polarisedimenticolaceae bacterium]|nr:hypothetical protein [Candidatus Polarisedimenticolaceae bacterium]
MARGTQDPGSEAAPPPSGQPCGGLGRAIARAFRQGKPEILAAGPLCGESIVYLAGRGARVHVDEITLPDPIPPSKPGEGPSAPLPFTIALPSGQCDLVLAWEILDFVPPERLVEFGSELVRVMRTGAQLLLFAHQKPPAEHAVIPRYRLLADDLIVREEPPGDLKRRYTHPNRDIERALAGLSIQGIQLQRNQLREILASKAGVG